MPPPDAKGVERRRYNKRALAALGRESAANLDAGGSASVAVELRAPYLRYEAAIRSHAFPGIRVLDLCCGDGRHLLTAAFQGAEVTGIDIAENSLEIAKLRAKRAGITVHLVAGDAEALPFGKSAFDLVTCAGGLSYVDLDLLIGELQRVLRSGGAFIFIDSLNHNPIYRLNRYVHFLRGRRSLSTLRRMPTLTAIERLRMPFPDLEVSYHGIFSFLAPLLRLMGAERIAGWLDRLDRKYASLKPMAFKVVGVGHRPFLNQPSAHEPR